MKMNWTTVFQVFLFIFSVLFGGIDSLFVVQDAKDDGSPPRSPRSVESPSIYDNAKLSERTQLLEQALQRTLEALSVKLGHHPFEDIISFLQGQTESSRRRSADKIVISEIITNLDSSATLNGTSSQESMV